MSTELAIRQQDAIQNLTLDETISLGQILAKSGFFQDSRDAAQCVVKILAGRELGFGPVASMTGIYIVKGRVTMSANLIAAAIQRSRKYTYRVTHMDANGCSIKFFENGQEIGLSTFTADDAKLAGLTSNDTYRKFARNMFFARALTNGARWYTPEIFGGPIYTPDEVGAQVDENGEIVQSSASLTILPINQSNNAVNAEAEPSAVPVVAKQTEPTVTRKDIKVLADSFELSVADLEAYLKRCGYGSKLSEVSEENLPAVMNWVKIQQENKRRALAKGAAKPVAKPAAAPAPAPVEKPLDPQAPINAVPVQHEDEKSNLIQQILNILPEAHTKLDKVLTAIFKTFGKPELNQLTKDELSQVLRGYRDRARECRERKELIRAALKEECKLQGRDFDEADQPDISDLSYKEMGEFLQSVENRLTVLRSKKQEAKGAA